MRYDSFHPRSGTQVHQPPFQTHWPASALQQIDAHADQIMCRTGKMLLAQGPHGGQRVTVKCPLEANPFWEATFWHEANVCRVFSCISLCLVQGTGLTTGRTHRRRPSSTPVP
ncbi:MAG: hypothetical protein JXA67_00385 [Micromonosporaceae bacterium]|nr:hypothetical protein [Micromonosporaceae bacterium]